MRRLSGALFLACLSILAAVAQQQIVDTDFRPAVAMPVYLKGGPTVAIDEAHDNFHTMAGQYAPLATLLRNDGYKVVGSKVPFEKENLRGIDVLIIANARNLKALLAGDISKPAFTDHECDVIADWVRAGGSLLLIAENDERTRDGKELIPLLSKEGSRAAAGWSVQSREASL
jgi:hypothetical protein